MTPRARPKPAVVALLVFSCAGCARACGSPSSDAPVDAGAPSRPLPELVHDSVPADATPRAPSDAKKARLAALGLRRGTFDDVVVLRVARDDDAPSGPVDDGGAASESIGVATVGFFHGSFAKAHPGFSLTKPTRLTPVELAILANDLAEASMTVLAATELAAARARWGKGATLLSEMDDEADWAATRPVLAEAARALSAKAKGHAEKKEALWVFAR